MCRIGARRVNNFITENVTGNLKFIVFHADDANSVKMHKRIFRKVEGDSIDKLVCDTRTNFRFVGNLRKVFFTLRIDLKVKN